MNNIASCLILFCFLLSAHALGQQDSLQLVVTGSDRAIVVLNNKRLVLRVGDKVIENVQLIEANSDYAVLSLNGKSITLKTDSVAAPVLSEPDYLGASAKSDSEQEEEKSEGSGRSITLWAESDGFFYATGKVNRKSVRFLVDTGATTVTFSSADADRLGLKYKNGKSGFASTASGITPTKTITLDKISLGRITVRNVVTSIIPGRFPDQPLLGGTFLNKLNMERVGKKMKLKKR